MMFAGGPASRPLRALAFVLGGWTTVRVIALWPAGSAADISAAGQLRAGLPPVAMSLFFDAFGPPFAPRKAVMLSSGATNRRLGLISVTLSDPIPLRRAAQIPEARLQPGLDGAQGKERVPIDSSGFGNTVMAVAPGLPARSHTRFSGSAWALMRGDGAPSLASGGQLGGSQAGVRLFYVPGPKALALTARISTPLSEPGGREVALGLALRGRNVGIIVEQRLALDRGGRDAPAVIAYAGVSDVALAGELKLDGYAQAGVVGIKSPAAFVDGALRVERTILRHEKSSLGIGAGAWGGAQPGVARIDVGPQIVAHVAVARTSLRVSAEWRQRVAGNAAPPSGPSVTVGFDF